MEMELPIVNNRLHIKVKPGARKTEILKVEKGIVYLNVAAQPEDGKANAEVERFLSRLTKRKVAIKSGFASREKIILFS